MAIFPDEAFTFYEGLGADNSKTYWNAHKDVYEQAVREPMRALLDKLAPVFGGEPTIFRPHRDVRFSKDKSPYKTAQGGVLEVAHSVGYYIQVDADGILVGGGFWPHDRDQTHRFRAAVDNDLSGKQLLAITAKLEKAGFDIGGNQVATRPRGVAADHPRLDLMRREHVTAGRHGLAPETVTAASVQKDWQKIKPLILWVLDNAAPSV